MNQPNSLPQIRTFRVGSKNKRIDSLNPGEPSGYQLVVETGLPLPQLLEHHGVVTAPEESRITPENFPHAAETGIVRQVELFDFSARSDYGRSGVDESFVREKLAHFAFRPATLTELVCFASQLREAHLDQWFEAKKILALGSVMTIEETARKGGWFKKTVTTGYRLYPELECVAGRPQDVLSLSQTELDSDGNWPSSTLFLAACL